MQVIRLIDLSILKDKNILIGNPLGVGGAHGEVFELANDPDKVIKFSIIYEVSKSIDELFNIAKNTFSFIIKNQIKPFVKVFNFEKICIGERNCGYSYQQYIIYSTVMEKLFPLSDDENKVFKSVCDSYNKNKKLEKNTIDELAQWYKIDAPRVLTFHSEALKCKLKHNDFHRRNILKDKNGDFKLIDLDLVEL